MINVVCGIRSTGRICTDLANALEENGHEVKIAYGRETVPEEFQKYAIRIGTDIDVKIHGLKARLFDGCGFGSSRATRKFIEWVKEFNPDVIHLHNLHGYYINVEILFNYLRSCGKRIIWTLHDCWAFTGHSALCDAVDCTKWRTGCGHCPQLSVYPKSFSDHSVSNWNKKKNLMQGIPNMKIITPSQWLAELVKESFLSEYEVSVIHNGIDTTQFYPVKSDFREKYGIDNKFMILGVASAWNKTKGLNDYIKLSQQLDSSFQVVLVGITEKQKKELPESVIAIDRTNSIRELASIYSAADLFVNLSYCENYPTVNLEAIACNTPVITYDTGGSNESASLYGKSVERGSVSSLISEIKQFKTIDFSEVEKPNLDAKETLQKYLDYYAQRMESLNY